MNSINFQKKWTALERIGLDHDSVRPEILNELDNWTEFY